MAPLVRPPMFELYSFAFVAVKKRPQRCPAVFSYGLTSFSPGALAGEARTFAFPSG